MAAEEMRASASPKAALLSHSNFGSSNQPSGGEDARGAGPAAAAAPWLEVDGEMHGDAALDAPTGAAR
jgi:malate dehydrogenase (oxaloacetate-decarboxylating)(NADP+)